jgi:hypothetical protein
MMTTLSLRHDVDAGRADYDNCDSNNKFNNKTMMRNPPRMKTITPTILTTTIHPSLLFSLLMPSKNKRAHVTFDKSLPTTPALQIPTTMHGALTIRDTLQTTVTVTAIMSLPSLIPLTMTMTKPTIRASLKQGELAIRASLLQGELLEPNVVTYLHQRSDAALVPKTENVELVMSDTGSAIMSTSLKNGSNSCALQALGKLLSAPYDFGRPPMLSC